MLIILAGCAGAGSGKSQRIHGTGFFYSAPAAWSVSGSAATNGAVDRMEVHTFRLERPYAAARRAATVRELDRDAASIAQQLHGKVSGRSALMVAGMHSWSYSIDYDGKTEELTFALDDRREYELLCRRAQGSGDGVCAELLRTFRVG